MSINRVTAKPIAEGFLAGAAALIVAIMWMIYSDFHPIVIFPLYLMALFCLSLSILWLLSKKKSVKEWLSIHSSRILILCLIEIALITVFFLFLYW